MDKPSKGIGLLIGIGGPEEGDESEEDGILEAKAFLKAIKKDSPKALLDAAHELYAHCVEHAEKKDSKEEDEEGL